MRGADIQDSPQPRLEEGSNVIPFPIRPTRQASTAEADAARLSQALYLLNQAVTQQAVAIQTWRLATLRLEAAVREIGVSTAIADAALYQAGPDGRLRAEDEITASTPDASHTCHQI